MVMVLVCSAGQKHGQGVLNKTDGTQYTGSWAYVGLLWCIPLWNPVESRRPKTSDGIQQSRAP